ncbi:hypothetical protein AGMMS49990_09880 [Endomicrobiia bacterium]|nr:hypothetical protein AGMMS49990_09880 [Endomicrobiia bacterium]
MKMKWVIRSLVIITVVMGCAMTSYAIIDKNMLTDLKNRQKRALEAGAYEDPNVVRLLDQLERELKALDEQEKLIRLHEARAVINHRYRHELRYPYVLKAGCPSEEDFLPERDIAKLCEEHCEGLRDQISERINNGIAAINKKQTINNVGLKRLLIG